MVLLKTNGDFPLRNTGEIALYGSGSRQTIKGGTGSGDVNSRFYVTVEQGLENAGFTITTKDWIDRYDRVQKQAHQEFVAGIKSKAQATGVPAIMLGMGAVMPEPEYELPFEGAGDTAIYVLSRISGEGSDRNAVDGDLKLTQTEIRDILNLAKTYSHFMLVLNVGGVVDLTPVLEVPNILILSQLGVVTGDALADVLLGQSYPSGKLTATWSAWDDYSQIGDFGQEDDTRYREGVYVGYRYFDSAAKTPLFPFGYGLGYTQFRIVESVVSLDGSHVNVTVTVKNMGSTSGKEVVQLYVSVPSGKLDQPFQTLAAFAKTEELAAAQSQQVTLSFAMEELSSFDTERAVDVLEAGDYLLRVGNSSRDTRICGIIRMDQELIIRQLSHAGGTPDFDDWKPEAQQWTYAGEADERANAPVLVLSANAFAAVLKPVVPEIDSAVRDLVEGLSDSELAWLCVGHYRSGNESGSVIGNAAFAVAGAAGETTTRLKEKGVPSLVMSDGPAGLRLSRQYGVDESGVYAVGDSIPSALLDYMDDTVMEALGLQKSGEAERSGRIFDQYCTALPIGTALAQSWNLDFCRACGDIVGDEMKRFGVHLWLAPAFNIHRSPLCGRNYEYFSEDPLISGRVAAAITLGVQRHPGCGVTIKHYVANNQETNRFRSNSVVSERALRDIYMRGFKICIEESQPHTLMTSYNLLNGVHTSERKDIIDGVLREEWGFDGIVISDWVVGGVQHGVKKYPYATAAKSIKAGNDVMMPGGEMDYTDVLTALAGTNKAVMLTRKEVQDCASRIIRIALRLTEAQTEPSIINGMGV
ncbi:glycoside hydrolase family 3 C-terminal domain-containing protein [Paenibacillus sonchi]|uniref:Glycoside hydrolase family 3 C-terminal domain-containing protein n=2 Tax=Paenibacillus sonchi TaxID=373687 RepID=A0A974SCT8_9BACL|nr:glycoside hydrolase family 3 C-terminal domain-containing protein [Paenibacillus sonchi]